jgi:hypothetical protein
MGAEYVLALLRGVTLAAAYFKNSGNGFRFCQ